MHNVVWCCWVFLQWASPNQYTAPGTSGYQNHSGDLITIPANVAGMAFSTLSSVDPFLCCHHLLVRVMSGVSGYWIGGRTRKEMSVGILELTEVRVVVAELYAELYGFRQGFGSVMDSIVSM